jgi:hypothetical protein
VRAEEKSNHLHPTASIASPHSSLRHRHQSLDLRPSHLLHCSTLTCLVSGPRGREERVSTQHLPDTVLPGPFARLPQSVLPPSPAMSAVQYGERGGHMRPSPPAVNSPDTVESNALSSPRSTVNPLHSSSASSSTVQSLATSGTLDSKLDSSPTHDAIRSGVLQDSFFPTWKDDAAGAELDDLEEMQKKDPLATQVWKLFSRAKTQLPNAERMENLTWRMMSMNMRKLELERLRFVRTRPTCLSSLQGSN